MLHLYKIKKSIPLIALSLVIILISAVVMYTCWNTPEWLSHATWNGVYCRAYTLSDDHKYRIICYNHEKSDGAIIEHKLRTNKKLPKLMKSNTPPTQCETWTRIQVENDVKESPFLKLVAYICSKSKIWEHTDSITSTIMIGTRHKLNNFKKKGCFVRTARTLIEKEDKSQHIADKHRQTINMVMNDERLYENIAERTSLVSTQFLFNKWPLGIIKREDGRVLQIYHGGTYVSVETVLNYTHPIELKCIQESKHIWKILINSINITI